MRLWSIHPRFLDSKGLVSCWREGLLAQKVLLGKTKGYKNHPQLNRFKKNKHTIVSMSNYLTEILKESKVRGYRFDGTKIVKIDLPVSLLDEVDKISVTLGQLQYEFNHLQKKLKVRDPEKYLQNISLLKGLIPHPMFDVIEGDIEDWEVLV